MPYQRKNLALDLVKVHDDRFSSLGGDKYFACVDMKGADGKIYDIDFFMVVQAREVDCYGNVRSQDQRQTALQLEARRRRLEKSEGVVVAAALWAARTRRTATRLQMMHRNAEDVFHHYGD